MPGILLLSSLDIFVLLSLVLLALAAALAAPLLDTTSVLVVVLFVLIHVCLAALARAVVFWSGASAAPLAFVLLARVLLRRIINFRDL
jgi:hypothetical protein